MNFFGHKDLGNHLLQLCPKVVKHPVYSNTLTATTNLFLFMHQDPKPVVRGQLQILSLQPPTDQPATDPICDARSFYRRIILAQLDKKCPLFKEPEVTNCVHNSSSQNPSTKHTNTVRTLSFASKVYVKLSNPTGHVTHQQFNIQQLYALPTLHLCVLYLSENKQRLVPLTA